MMQDSAEQLAQSPVLFIRYMIHLFLFFVNTCVCFMKLCRNFLKAWVDSDDIRVEKVGMFDSKKGGG